MENLPSLTVPTREVPIPSTVSPELQKQIAAPIPPMVAMPTTAEGWKALQKEANQVYANMAIAGAQQLGITIETIDLDGVTCYRVSPKSIAPGKENHAILHVHGGAFLFNAGMAAIGEAMLLAQACQTQAISIDYRMPPDYTFPAAPDDVLTVWKALMKNYDPKSVVMGGTSAGAGLIMTTMLRCKQEGIAMPAALFLGTPFADLTKTGDSLYLNAEVDRFLGRYEGRLVESTKLYAGSHDLHDELLSPIYGDLSGFPPAILVSGTRDLLLSTTSRVHRKLRDAGIPADLHVYEGMSHGDYLVAFLAPEAQNVMKEVALFFDRYWQP
ncbi:MAG: alpha/beta hydrolase [Cyanosarcina radialis HA8281-LM2]|jgi:acetyl esterase/lipase|nr:alpha/beta hydrolase [Cyanosarcina radialis HA8281-LM2]